MPLNPDTGIVNDLCNYIVILEIALRILTVFHMQSHYTYNIDMTLPYEFIKDCLKYNFQLVSLILLCHNQEDSQILIQIIGEYVSNNGK